MEVRGNAELGLTQEQPWKGGAPQFQYCRFCSLCGNQGNAGGYEKTRDGVRRTDGMTGGTPSSNIANFLGGVVTGKPREGAQ